MRAASTSPDPVIPWGLRNAGDRVRRAEVDLARGLIRQPWRAVRAGATSETIRQAKDLPASDIISMLHSAVLHFANGTEQQDVRAVIVKRERNGARRES